MDHYRKYYEDFREIQFRAGETKSLEEEGEKKYVTEVVASRETVDRMGDVVLQNWKMANYEKNPVILFNHDPSKVVGRAVGMEIVEEEGTKSLKATIEWDVGAHNPLGTMIGEQFKRGVLNAVSVGFRALHIKRRSDLDPDDDLYSERGALLGPNELLEISAVSIPAHPDALAVRANQEEEVEMDFKSMLLDALRNDVDVRACVEAIQLKSFDSKTEDESRESESEVVEDLQKLLKSIRQEDDNVRRS